MLYPKILSEVYNCPLLIHPAKLEAIRRVVTQRAFGVRADAETIAAIQKQAASDRQPQVTRSVAVLPIVGTLSKRIDMMEEASGGVSTDRIGKAFDSLLADDSVGAIVLAFDSPGGQVYGTQELADKIYAARGAKRIVAVADAVAASAAYWIASAADELSVTPSGEVGSVGVFAVHTDFSKWNEAEGVQYTYIHAGKFKVEGNRDAPLSEEALSHYQAQVDAIYDTFTKTLARNRGTTAAKVRSDFGQGRMLMAGEAKAAGMVDRIETLDEAISRLAGTRKSGRGARAEIERRRLNLLNQC